MADPARWPADRGLTVMARLLAALLAGLLTPVTAVAADGPAWTATPGPGGDRPYIYAEGAPGTVLEDTLAVTNPGTKPLTVRLRADGEGSRIALAAPSVTVPPRTRAEVPLSLTVPPDAVPGDHRAAVTASSGGRESRVRIHLRVSGPLLAALTVEDVSVTGGTIRYTLVNRGNTVLSPRVTITADGLFGEVLRRTPGGLPAELLPARRITLTENWRDRPALDAVQVRVRATAAGAPAADATTSARFVPWAWCASALALGAAAAALWLRRRRGRPSAPECEQATADRQLARSGA